MNPDTLQTIVTAMQCGNHKEARALTDDFMNTMHTDNKLCSRLTNKGIPVEFAFVWPHYSVRCTADADMYSSQLSRFNKSVQKLEVNNNTSAGKSIVEGIQQHLRNEPDNFRYGAWLGYRPARHQPKLYAEVAPSVRKHKLLDKLVPDVTSILTRGIEPVMFGWQADTDSYEVYYKATYLRPGDIDTLLSFYNLGSKGAEITCLCERLLNRRVHSSFPMPDIGFSVSFNNANEPETFTLYAFAQSMLGTDDKIREDILRLGRQEKWNMELYEMLSQKLTVPLYDVNTFHGMVGFAVAKQGTVQFTVGLSPVMGIENPISC